MRILDRCANFLAKNSITNNQKNRYIRGICRKGYRTLSNLYCAISPEFIRLQDLIKKEVLIDSYPWPYREPWFADWEEDGTRQEYSLVSDQAGFVVKHSTSYCAWKIYELTGSWPIRPKHLPSCDAKHWRRLLHDNDYCTTVKRPGPGKHYVGIAPSMGLHGECVWFEGFDDGHSVERNVDTGGEIIYSTYRDRKYGIGAALDEWYIWVEIGKKT